jgi:hypothetical protein
MTWTILTILLAGSTLWYWIKQKYYKEQFLQTLTVAKQMDKLLDHMKKINIELNEFNRELVDRIKQLDDDEPWRQ